MQRSQLLTLYLSIGWPVKKRPKSYALMAIANKCTKLRKKSRDAAIVLTALANKL